MLASKRRSNSAMHWLRRLAVSVSIRGNPRTVQAGFTTFIKQESSESSKTVDGGNLSDPVDNKLANATMTRSETNGSMVYELDEPVTVTGNGSASSAALAGGSAVAVTGESAGIDYEVVPVAELDVSGASEVIVDADLYGFIEPPGGTVTFYASGRVETRRCSASPAAVVSRSE